MTEPERVRVSLEHARDHGDSFDAAWSLALNGVHKRIRNSTYRAAVLGALTATAAAWERAYLREPPTPGERAAAWLLDALDEREPLDEPLGVPVGTVLG